MSYADTFFLGMIAGGVMCISFAVQSILYEIRRMKP